MLFHTFASQEERKEFGGSCFIEFQYCAMSQREKLSKIVSADAIMHWKNNSLYLHGDDMNEFFAAYGEIFTDGYYNDQKCGVVDMWGLNYYTPAKTEQLINRLQEEKPKDYQVLLEWLKKAKDFNGFYILGV